MGQPCFRFRVAPCVVKTGAELMCSLTLNFYEYENFIQVTFIGADVSDVSHSAHCP